MAKKNKYDEEQLETPAGWKMGPAAEKTTSMQNLAVGIVAMVASALVTVFIISSVHTASHVPMANAATLSSESAAAAQSAQSEDDGTATAVTTQSAPVTGVSSAAVEEASNTGGVTYVRRADGSANQAISGKWTPVDALSDGAFGYVDNSYSYNSGSGTNSGSGLTWHEPWTETIVHPAVTETEPGIDTYVCDTCGYESLDLKDIENHVENEEHEGYTLIPGEPVEVVVEEEWTETIKHEGYWG